MWKIVLLALAFPFQSQPSRPAFEVASVKLNTENGESNFVPKRSGERVIMHNTQIGSAVYYAYHVRFSYQIVGSLNLPAGWNWYDIEARAPESTSDDDLRLMFQTLLEDRFKLKVHRETREMEVYNLFIAKGGPKLKPAVDNPNFAIDGRPIGKNFHSVALGVDGAHLMGTGATISQLAESLSGQMHGPVIDKTALDGKYDYDVLFARENKPDDQAPSLPAAIQSLGLKLERSKAPVEVLVVDHIEKPSQN